MSTEIHPTAIIDPSAEIADNVKIGAYCVIGSDVKIGAGTVLHASSQIMGNSTLGENNQVFPGAIIGGAPQDSGYKEEPTKVVIGDNNVIREFVTINRGTTKQDGVTIIGNNCMLMAYTHVAHDCVVGDNVIFANLAQIAGHCVVQDNVFMSAGSMVHQFATIGERCFIAANTIVKADCIPGVSYKGHPAEPKALNIVGLKRAGLTKEQLRATKKAFKLICRSEATSIEKLDEFANSEYSDCEFAQKMIALAKNKFSNSHKRNIQPE